MSLVKKTKKKQLKKDLALKEAEEHRFLDELNKTKAPDTSTKKQLFMLLVAFLTACVPSYLFQSVVDLRFEGLALMILYLIVVGLSTIFLYKGYAKVYVATRRGVELTYRKKMEGANVTMDEKGKLIETGSFGYTFWLTNVIFIFFMLIASFYMLKGYDPRFNYSVSLIGSSYLTKIFVERQPEKKKKKRKRLFP